jgi:glucose-1-phosphate thymidylyltransferase
VKGLVLAGGRGTRLRPLTRGGAKQLVPIGNKPVLFYVLDTLVRADVTDIVVVVSPETGAEVREALGDGARWGARLTFVLQDRPLGLAHAVLTARQALGGDPFCMFLGDNLIGAPIDDLAARFRATHELSASLLLKEVSDPSRFGVAELDARGEIVRLVEKPTHPRSNLALVGIYFFRSPIFDAIARITPSARGELEITDAIVRLLEMGASVRFDRVTSWWLDTGKKDDVLLANDTVLDHFLEPALLGEIDAESRCVGKVRIERGARVVRSTIEGPAVVGAAARIEDAVVEPHTSIGDGAAVIGCTIGHSVLMAGARVTGPGRVHDSIVGRRAVVRSGGGAQSVVVGDDTILEPEAVPG